ncbi:MAG TPA: FkbM family methyltransferase [Vicinamibacterales bacterium]
MTDAAELWRRYTSYAPAALPRYLVDSVGYTTSRRSFPSGLVKYRLRNGAQFFARPFTADRLIINELFATDGYVKLFDINPGDTVVDLGAHIGVFAVFAARRAAGVRVYCYEPLPETYGLLERNVRTNRLRKQVTMVRAAVSGTSGTLPLYFASGQGMGTLSRPGSTLLNRLEVASVTIPDIFATHRLPRINFLKVDIESGEFDAFESLPREYLARIDRIAMECHLAGPPSERRPQRLEQIKEQLRSAGFELHVAQGERPSLRQLYAWRPGA